MLTLRDAEIRSALKSQRPPSRGFRWHIPARVSRRTDHHSEQFSGHGMTVVLFRIHCIGLLTIGTQNRRHKRILARFHLHTKTVRECLSPSPPVPTLYLA